MHKVNSFSASPALTKFVESVCPIDAHIDVIVRGTWVDGDEKAFSNQHMSTETTRLVAIRCFSYHGNTFYVRETWEHDNGYRASIEIISKADFLAAIRS